MTMRFAVLAMTLLLACAGSNAAEGVTVTTLVPGTPMHGIQGLAWGADGMLYAGAISAQKISRIDPRKGTVDVVVDSPSGEADDLAIASDGTLAWTAIASGELRIRRPGEPMQVLAKGLPGINPVAFRRDGRLVAGQLGPVNALYEFDPTGRTPPRKITTEVDNLNGFEFGADGRLYGPFWQAGVLVAIDIDSGAVTRLATGLNTPSAVNLDSRGHLISVDYNTGDVRRTDPASGASKVIVTLEPPLDNLAVGDDDTIYVSDTARSGVIAVDPSTGASRRIVGGEFSTPGGMKMVMLDGRETLIVADSTGYRFVDPADGKVTRPRFDMGVGASLDVAASDDVIAMTDVRFGRVYKIDRRTRKLLQDVRDLKGPYGVLILEDGDLLVADYLAGALVRVGEKTNSVVAQDLRGPVGLVLVAPDAVYVSENTSGTLTRVDLETGAKREVAADLQHPEGLALMKDGRLVIAEAGARRVVAIDLHTQQRSVLASDLPPPIAALRTPSPVGMPTGVAVGRDGAIYISSDGDNSIRKIVVAAQNQKGKTK